MTNTLHALLRAQGYHIRHYIRNGNVIMSLERAGSRYTLNTGILFENGDSIL